MYYMATWTSGTLNRRKFRNIQHQRQISESLSKEFQFLHQFSLKQLNYFTFNVITLYVFILDNVKSIFKEF